MSRRSRHTVSSDTPRRRGGQELPDELQDRPEQNKGYDEAVREGPPLETADLPVDVDTVDDDPEAVAREVRREASAREASFEQGRADAADDRAARAAASEVRRRERRNAG